MITLFYTVARDVAKDESLEPLLQKIPVSQRQKILSYKSRHEQLLRICGKLLLANQLKLYNLTDDLSLHDIKYNQWNKPFLCSFFDFNISHSGDIVICAGILNGKIGVDVEQVKAQDISLYEDYFSRDQWREINSADNKYPAFYDLWVRKEAIVKATGKGAYLSFAEIDAGADHLKFENETLYLNRVFIKEGYAACVASDSDTKDIRVIEVNFETLINL